MYQIQHRQTGKIIRKATWDQIAEYDNRIYTRPIFVAPISHKNVGWYIEPKIISRIWTGSSFVQSSPQGQVLSGLGWINRFYLTQ